MPLKKLIEFLRQSKIACMTCKSRNSNDSIWRHSLVLGPFLPKNKTWALLAIFVFFNGAFEQKWMFSFDFLGTTIWLKRPMTGVTLPAQAIQVMAKIIVASCKATFWRIFLKFHMDWEFFWNFIWTETISKQKKTFMNLTSFKITGEYLITSSTLCSELKMK